jgi:diaminopimelate epimerase
VFFKLEFCPGETHFVAMIVEFTKMNGAGNDFVLMDNREGSLELTPEHIRRLCDRQRGIGADGLILLKPCSSGKADWAWDFHNSDGSRAEMCGNGARCFARYVKHTVNATGRAFRFETDAGIVGCEFSGDRVTVELTEPSEPDLNREIEGGGKTWTVHSINTGVPHAVVFVENADRAMVEGVGRFIRRHPQFSPAGTNVNFVSLAGANAIRARTYERGVEGETLACGTGVTAAALISALIHGFTSPVQVAVQGGDLLHVGFERQDHRFARVRLTGPADMVFQGRIELNGGGAASV